MNKLKRNESANMKIAYIAHPISGDVEGNLKRIQKIVRQINLTLNHIVPFVPYFADCIVLDDADERERARGLANDLAILRSGIVDYLWLYGPEITRGMRSEMAVAREHGIMVLPMSRGTQIDYDLLQQRGEWALGGGS